MIMMPQQITRASANYHAQLWSRRSRNWDKKVRKEKSLDLNSLVIVLSEISLFFILPAPRLAVWAVPAIISSFIKKHIFKKWPVHKISANNSETHRKLPDAQENQHSKTNILYFCCWTGTRECMFHAWSTIMITVEILPSISIHHHQNLPVDEDDQW